MKKNSTLFCCILMLIFLGISCGKTSTPAVPQTPPANTNPVTNVPPVSGNAAQPLFIQQFLTSYPGIDNTPVDNPITDAGFALGRVLFYDKKLSVNNTISCASCHHQDKAFTDGVAFSKGFDGKTTRRNSMPLINLRYFMGKKMFWDLRAENLETQTVMPITDMIEMGMPSLTNLEDKLNGISYYPDLFNKAFGSSEINSNRIAKALAQFIRSIESFNSKYDQGVANNFASFSEAELNGRTTIRRMFCTECHSDLKSASSRSNLHPSFLTVENFGLNNQLLGGRFLGTNNGLDLVYTDNGIGEITGKSEDMGTFKIPSLRNVELTAPYMHDGRFATLEQVLEHYSTGIKGHSNRGIQMPAGGIKLTEKDKSEIIAFLKTLTDRSIASNTKFASPF